MPPGRSLVRHKSREAHGPITVPKSFTPELRKARERASSQCPVMECTLTWAQSGLLS